MKSANMSFTLIELLIVIAVVFLLISLLNPSFQKVTETAQRAECMARQKNFITVSLLMWEDNAGVLPSSEKSHARSFTPRAFDRFMEYVEMENGITCPNVNFEGKGNKPIRRPGYLYHIGYQYFGNNPWLMRLKRANNPRRNYKLPKTTLADPDSVLVADDNSRGRSGVHETGGNWILAPHNAFNDQVDVPVGTTHLSVGADGGNVGYLDGSVAWRDMHDMQEYYNAPGNDKIGYW